MNQSKTNLLFRVMLIHSIRDSYNNNWSRREKGSLIRVDISFKMVDMLIILSLSDLILLVSE